MTLDEMIKQLQDIREIIAGKCEVQVKTYTQSIQNIKSVTFSDGRLVVITEKDRDTHRGYTPRKK